MSQDRNLTCARCGYFGGLHICGSRPEIINNTGEPLAEWEIELLHQGDSSDVAPATDLVVAVEQEQTSARVVPADASPASAGATPSLRDSNMLKMAEAILLLTNQAGHRDERIEQLEAQVLHLNRRLTKFEAGIVSVPFMGEVT